MNHIDVKVTARIEEYSKMMIEGDWRRLINKHYCGNEEIPLDVDSCTFTDEHKNASHRASATHHVTVTLRLFADGTSKVI